MATPDYHGTNVSITRCNDELARNQTYMLFMLNEERVRTLVPAMVLLGVFMLVGITGNTLVCIIFCKKLEHTTQTFLYICLAVFDLISCCVGMPSEIVDIRLYYMFDSVVACKILRFFLTFPTISSNVTLLVIAVDRFRKVCRPLHSQMSRKVAKVCVGVAVAAGVLFAMPTLFIYGRRSTRTRIPGVVGSDCSVSDELEKHYYPLVYELFLVAAFVAFTVALTVLYLRIWKSIKQHNKNMNEHAVIGIRVRLKRDGDVIELQERSSSSRMSKTSELLSPIVNAEYDAESFRTKPRDLKKGNRATVVAFLVTFVFIVSFLPHLSLIVSRTLVKDFDLNLEGAGLCAYNIFIRSYFVNSVANPIIYGFMNTEFRKECAHSFRKWFYCFKKHKQNLNV